VPEAKKALFREGLRTAALLMVELTQISKDTHAVTVTQLLRGSHVVINARNEADVLPEVIMTRVSNASGSKYSVQKDAPRKYEPIAPVGTAYQPVGQVNIAELRKGAPRDVPPPAVS
jgi:hypothetical protein